MAWKWLDDLIYRKTNKYPCALPEHLRNWEGTDRTKLHNDWPPLLNKASRAWNVRGPRCGEGNPGFLPWPPKLIKGYGVARWQTAGDQRRIFVPSFVAKKIIAEDLDGLRVNAIDLKSKPHRQVWVNLLAEGFGPSTLQKLSPKGWMKLDPSFQCRWKILKKREVEGVEKSKTGADRVLFWRWGWRPDFVDEMYNYGPYVGMAWN